MIGVKCLRAKRSIRQRFYTFPLLPLEMMQLLIFITIIFNQKIRKKINGLLLLSCYILNERGKLISDSYIFIDIGILMSNILMISII